MRGRVPDLGRLLTLVGLVSAAVYIFTVQYDFVWDDRDLVAENAYIRSPRFVAEYFRRDFGTLSHGALAGGYYRPLLALSFFADYQVWGNNPAGFHLTNLLLHVVCSLLVTLLARRLSGQDVVGALAGLFFAVHPAHVESVAFVSARVDILLASFGVASILAALAARRARGPVRLAWQWLEWAGVTGALLSKESGVVVPGLIVLCLAWDARRDGTPWRTAIAKGLRESTGTFVVLALYLVGRKLFLPLPVSWSDFAQGPSLWQRLITGIYLGGRILGLATVGFPWQPLYQMAFLDRVDARVVVSGLLLAGLGWGIWWGLARGALAALGGLWVLAAIFPVLNVIPTPVQGVYFADRFAYLPSVGVALVAGHLGVALLLVPLDVWRRRLALAAMAAGLVALGVMSAIRSEVWRDNDRLYAVMLERSPHSPKALTNLAWIALQRGQPDEAARLLRQVLAQVPNHGPALILMGKAHLASGRTDEGFAFLTKAVQSYPADPGFLTNLGAALIRAQRSGEAIPYLQRAVSADPQYPPALMTLGLALALEGDLDEGVRVLRKAEALRPDSPEPRIQIGRILLDRGQPAEALVEFQVALRLDPGNPAATWAMARSLDLLDRRTEARVVWERLRETTDNEWVRKTAEDEIRKLRGREGGASAPATAAPTPRVGGGGEN